ncbi:hypothetical protein [Mesorhizobium sp. BAC0120]|uniref:hypothetical protein n=1 Tax=Mesorhizobium sp. BAC0120 TaxID=3090670 RepID=UPI00298D4291|nr:hypothetical protein [Mesorhizobium sp. BAC0120]
MMKTLHAFWPMLAVAPVALCLGISALQAAPTQAQQQAIRSSCQSDYRSYCASVPTGGSAALQCLEKNLAKLSQSCQQAVQAATGSTSTAAPKDATAPAAPAPAAAAAPKPTSPAAKGPVIVVLKPGQEIALMRRACGTDYRQRCSGVAPGQGRAVQCLVSHASSLSGTCKGALSKLGQKF